MGPRTAGSRAIEILHDVKSKCKLRYCATSLLLFDGKHISLNRDSSGVYIFSDTAILGLAQFVVVTIDAPSTPLSSVSNPRYLFGARRAEQILPFNNISSSRDLPVN